MTDIKTLPKEDQERWLEQRGWRSTERTGAKMWKHPDTGTPYIHALAMEKALDACKLPSDYQLDVVLPPTDRD